MSKISAVIATSHTPFLFQPLSWWKSVKSGRRYAPDLPTDSDLQSAEKKQRIDTAFETLRSVFKRAKPDVVLVFGDDQEEQFELSNHPAFAMFTGSDLAGYRAIGYEGDLRNPVPKPRTPEHWTEVKTHPALAKKILRDCLDSGFDLAFMTELPKKEVGIGHAFTRPLSKLDPEFEVPVIPLMVNCYYPPQPKASRCVALARRVKQIVEDWPEDINVVILASGGLWHTPGAPDAYIDGDFDRSILGFMEARDADGAAAYFDNWKPIPPHSDSRSFQAFSGPTGMDGGIGSGSGETRNWIMASAVAEGRYKLVDYIPIYDSPVGAAFAYWDNGTDGQKA